MAILSSSTQLRTVEQLKQAYEEAFEATRAAWDAYMAASAAWQEALETPIFATTRDAWRARVDEARLASNAAGEHFHHCMDIEARTFGELNGARRCGK